MIQQLIAVLAALAVISLPISQQTVTDTSVPYEASALDEPLYDEGITVRLQDGGTVMEQNLHDYLIQVVLQEMPASFEPEALCAQAVAARTFTMRCIYSQARHDEADICGDPQCCQCYLDESEGQALYGTEYESAKETVRIAVEATDGQVLTYDGELIEAAYFSSAAEQTEPASAVWGTNVPYLQSVSSPEEVRITEATFTFSEFKAIFSEAALSGSAGEWFGSVTYTAGGGVDTMEIGGTVYTGTEIRSLLGLRSTHFTPAIADDVIIFEVRGSGHGVGMSQYGANAMAAAGADYGEILTHYYTGAGLQQLY